MSGDHFENIVCMLLQVEGYWVAQSFKVNLAKGAKRSLGKHSMPRPEIDLLAFDHAKDQVLVLETKSYLDSPGVKYADLSASYAVPTGRYKLFTCTSYQQAVLAQLRLDLTARGMIGPQTSLRLGLVAGNVYRGDHLRVRRHLQSQGYFYWSPALVRRKLRAVATHGYENDPAIITAKLLLR